MKRQLQILFFSAVTLTGTACAETKIGANYGTTTTAASVVTSTSKLYSVGAPALDGDWTKVLSSFQRDSNPILPTSVPAQSSTQWARALAILSPPSSVNRAQLASFLNGKVGIDVSIGGFASPSVYGFRYPTAGNEAGIVLGYKGTTQYLVISLRADLDATGTGTRISICMHEAPGGAQGCGDYQRFAGFVRRDYRLEVVIQGGRGQVWVNGVPTGAAFYPHPSGGAVGVFGAVVPLSMIPAGFSPSALPAPQPTLRGFRVDLP